MKHLGDPSHPCRGIERSRNMINAISTEAEHRVNQGATTLEDVEAGITELRHDTTVRLGLTCSKLCPKLGRCLLDSFGNDDPLLRREPWELTHDESLELDAKRHYDMLTMLTKMSMGIM